MGYEPPLRHRRSIRLCGYDYRDAGAYYITLCIHGRLQLLAEVVGDRLVPTPAGQMVISAWLDIPSRFCGVELDQYVLMPDHFHGIIVLPSRGEVAGSSLADIVRRFKTWTGHLYGIGVRDQGWAPYEGQLWQRNYYEHIIRNERDLDEIRAYISANPATWLAGQHDQM